MSKFKKILIPIFTLLTALTILVPTFALSYFIFNKPDETIKDVNNGLNRYDDIKENYSGENNSSKTYTIYFFPSTLYAHIEYEHIMNNTNEFTNPKPEETFGYVEYDVETETFSEVKPGNQNNEYIMNSNQSYGDAAYYNSVSNSNYQGDEYCFYNDVKTYLQNFNDYNGSIPEELQPYSDAWNDFGRDYGLPEDFNKTYSNGDRTGNHYKFRNDRLGYRPNKNPENNGEIGIGEGRYLPIKVTIKDTLPMYVYNHIVEYKPMADMGDSSSGERAWYNFSFAGWGYFDESKNFSAPKTTFEENEQFNYDDNYVQDSFTSGDCNNIFDILNDLSEYDPDGDGIIKLFPIFSNGKKYGLNNDTVHLGGRDALKLTYQLKDGYSYETNEQYFLYSTDKISYTEDNIEVTYASINNINLDFDKYENMKIQGAALGLEGAGDWTGTWSNLLLDSKYIIGANNSSYEVINNFGEGLYNIYIFTVSPTIHGEYVEGYHNYGSIENVDATNTALEKYSNFISNDLLSNIVQDYMLFKTLKNKDLEFIQSNPVSIGKDSKNVVNDGLYKYITNTYVNSKCVIAIEKITESKFIQSVDIGNNIASQTEGDNYDLASSMLYVKEPVYLGNSFNTESIRLGQGIEQDHVVITDVDANRVNDEFNSITNKVDLKEDVVLLRNVDFTNYSTLREAAFQIRLFEKYQSNLNFIETDESNLKLSGNSSAQTFEALIYNPKDNNLNASNIFLDASYYFNLVNAGENITLNSDGLTYYVDQRVYVPRHTSYLGMYDFMLYHNKENNTYKLYAYRHSNATIRVFTEDQEDNNNDGYVDVNDTQLIWQRNTNIGSYAEIYDQGTCGKASGDLNGSESSFENVITHYLNDKEIGTYYLRDHVTGIDLFEIIKDEEGNIEFNQLLTNFRIRKSYIFYLTTEKGLGE